MPAKASGRGSAIAVVAGGPVVLWLVRLVGCACQGTCALWLGSASDKPVKVCRREDFCRVPRVSLPSNDYCTSSFSRIVGRLAGSHRIAFRLQVRGGFGSKLIVTETDANWAAS